MAWEYDPTNPTGGGTIPLGSPPPGGWELTTDGNPSPEPGAWVYDPDDPTNGGTILEGAPALGGWEEDYVPPGSVSGTPEFTYNLATTIGQLRFLIADTSAASYLFTDAELAYLLAKNGNDQNLAGAEAYETWARDRVRLRKSWRNAKGGSTYYDAADLLKMADRLREAPLRSGLATGSLVSSSGEDYLDEYRPEWRGFFDQPLIE